MNGAKALTGVLLIVIVRHQAVVECIACRLFLVEQGISAHDVAYDSLVQFISIVKVPELCAVCLILRTLEISLRIS